MAAANEKKLRDSFREFDTDNSGSIDLKEMKCVIKRYFKLAKKKTNDKQITAVATKLMQSYDTDGDGKISLEEFVNAFRYQNPEEF